MFAQYSPLFTSGLLSDSPASSRAPSPLPRTKPKRKPTHDSLPLSIGSDVFGLSAAPRSAAEFSENAFFLTLKPSRRQVDEGRSFLSLDLADAHRSMSLRRKDTVTTAQGRSVPTSPVRTSHPIPRRSSPILRRGSRETVALPSPKPAPSTSLPEVPRSRHRPSNLTLTFSACFPETNVTSPTSFPHHRSTHSEPVILSPPLRSSPILSPNENRSYFHFSPTIETPLTPPLTTGASDSSMPPEPVSAPAHIMQTLKTSPSTRSTASVNTRQRNRSAALAALEGRNGARRHVPVKRLNNFMSMSDDEDDDGAEMEKKLLGIVDEEEDVVVPTEAAKPAPVKETKRASKSTSGSSESKRSRRSTIDSFLSPLTNFIDLRDEDTPSRSWRSFVELA